MIPKDPIPYKRSLVTRLHELLPDMSEESLVRRPNRPRRHSPDGLPLDAYDAGRCGNVEGGT